MAHLVAMSLDDFRGLPQQVVPRTIRMRDSFLTSQDAIDWIFIGYCEKLIDKNEPLADLLHNHRGHMDDDVFVNETTKGQRLLLHLAVLDGQTRNGGVAQFIWNCPEMVLTALDALASLDYPELLASYQNVVDRLELVIDKWNRLRHSEQYSSDDMWDNFDAANELINGEDFDDPYYDHIGATARRKALQYVNANTHEFIVDKYWRTMP